MKPTGDNLHDDDRRFDLLVDAELSEEQRRELLAGLDDEPGGWRRCALAFLESQSWRKELGAIVRQPAERPPVKSTTRPQRGGRRVLIPLAMAASFLAALALGLRLQDAWRTGGPAPGPSIDALAGTQTPRPAREVPAPEIPGLKAIPGEELTPQPSDAPSDRWQMVTVAGPQRPDGTSGSIRLPAVERDRIDEDWLNGFPAAIPEEVLQALERTGHRVRRHRELVPLPMQDGRRLVVPVDQVDVHYVDRPTL